MRAGEGLEQQTRLRRSLSEVSAVVCTHCGSHDNFISVNDNIYLIHVQPKCVDAIFGHNVVKIVIV